MPFISESSFQKSSSRCSKENSVHIPSQRSQIPRFHLDSPDMCPDAHQCLEDSNNSKLHLSGRNGNTSARSSEFDKKSDFLHRHRYGKQLHPSGQQGNTVLTLSLIRQDMEENCNRLDIRATPCGRGPYYGIYMQQKCNHLDAALIWYCVKRVMESQLHSC
jgi:hypothetical protein